MPMLIVKKISFWIAIVGLISITSLILRLNASSNKEMPEPPITPAKKTFSHAIAASGLVEAIHENTLLGVPHAGLVEQVHVQVWDKVKTGDVILSLDRSELDAQKLVLEAQGSVAKASLDRLQDQLTRLQSLSDPRAISVEELKTRQHDVAVAKAQCSAAEAAVMQNQKLAERLVVRAPIDGTVLQVNVRKGETIGNIAGVAPIVLGNIDEVQVRADVDEQIAPRVKKGKHAIGYLKGDTEHPISMSFVRIEPFVIPKKSLTGASNERVDTRVLQVIFKFPNNLAQAVYVGQQLDLYIEE